MRPLALAMLVLLAACKTASPAPEPKGTPAERAIASGHAALSGGDTQRAIAEFRRALAAEPSPAAMRGLVEAHLRAGRLEAMRRELEAAIAAHPQDALAHYGLGLACFAGPAGGEACALEHLDRAAALEPRQPEFPYRLGLIHLEAERFAEAAEALKRARDLAPAVARHRIPLAMAFTRLGERKAALEELRAVVDLPLTAQEVASARKVVARLNDPFREFPKSIDEPFQRGLDFLGRLDSPQQALVTFEEILERFPDLAPVHAALGLTYLQLDDAGRALDELRRALELAPEDPLNHQYLGDLYYSRERFDKAADSYHAALERDPLSDRAYERLGQMAAQRGNWEEAARNFRRLAALRPDDLEVRQNLGVALLGQGALDDAQRELEAVVEKDPKRAEALLRLGMVHLERRRTERDAARARQHAERAAALFEKVLDLQPQNAAAARLLKASRP